MIEVRISYKVKRDLEEAKFASKCNFQENWFVYVQNPIRRIFRFFARSVRDIEFYACGRT